MVAGRATGFDEFLAGSIDEARIYDTALTASQIADAASLVVLNTNDTGPGSLRQVLASAVTGSTITFNPALSGQTILLTSGQLLVAKNLTIDASALGNGIQINGNADSRHFRFASGTTNLLKGLTLTNGSDSYGGGIYNDTNAHTTVENCTLTGNYGGLAGGGIYNAGTLTLNNSTLSGNLAFSGGGISGSLGGASSTITVNKSTLSSNTTFLFGGGLYCGVGIVTVNNFTFTGNSAGESHGGGLYCDRATAAPKKCAQFCQWGWASGPSRSQASCTTAAVRSV